MSETEPVASVDRNIQKTRRAGIAGWMLFDFAAQPFFTVVITFIFGPYFVSQLAADAVTGQAWWGYTITLSGLAIAILSPALGSIADATGSKKRWIGAFAIVKIIALTLLWFAAPGTPLIHASTLIILAAIAAEFSIVFNDSMMPRLVAPAMIGRISNIAWGLGYLGGMLFLIAVIAFLAGDPETGLTLIGLDPFFGLDPAMGEGARATGPFAALWYFVFILPMFLFTPDSPAAMPLAAAIRSGLGDLKSTLGELRNRTGLLRFLIARMLYQDGVNGLLALGGTFAASMFAWSTMELGVYGIILNIVAIGGCLAASVIDQRLGSWAVVMISLVMLCIATLGIVSTGPGFTLFGALSFSGEDTGGLFGTSAEKAYVLFGLLIGLAFGPVQASSRSLMAQSVSAEEAGRYFGIYALAGRITSFLAPFAVATVTLMTGSTRMGMSMLIVFLVLGMAILFVTPAPRRS